MGWELLVFNHSTCFELAKHPSIQCLLTSNVEPYSILKESFLKFLRM